jgi:hypothetical protein
MPANTRNGSRRVGMDDRQKENGRTMLPILLAAAVSASEPLVNPLDVLTAMGACVRVVEISPVGGRAPGVLFHVASDPPSGGWLGLTVHSLLMPIESEFYAHPRHPEITLQFGELAGDLPERDAVGANRDAIAACFEDVL